MTHVRFSLLGLVGVVTLVALGCAALVYASTWLSGVVWGATFLTLLFAVLASVLSLPARRSWWLGFALFGWMYLLTLAGPLSLVYRLMPIDGWLEKGASAMPKATITKNVATDTFAGAGGMGEISGVSIPGLGISGTMGDGAMIGGGSMAGGYGMADGMPMGGSADVNVTFQTLNTEYMTAFVRTGHALVTLLLACLGGLAGRMIYERNRADKIASTRSPEDA